LRAAARRNNIKSQIENNIIERLLFV